MDGIPDFIPATAEDVVVDLSHTLTATQIKSIENKADSLSYRPMVLVLPSDYQCPDVHQLSLALAKYWHADAGRTVLMVVDLKGHKVRIIGSPTLNAEGITSDYITNDLVPKTFIPYMKAGDLGSAIKLSLGGVNNRLVSSEKFQASGENQIATTGGVVSGTGSSGSLSVTDGHVTHISLWGLASASLAILALISFLVVFVGKKANSGKFAGLRLKLDSLYKQADQLGEASSFIDFMKNERLSHEISDFFAQLETLETAFSQTEKLVRSPISVSKAGDAVNKCWRYANLLSDNATDLLRRTNAITGVVSTYEPKSEITLPEEQRAVQSEPARIAPSNTIQLRPGAAYRVPVWVSNRRIIPASDSGLSDITYYFNQQSSASSFGNFGGNSSPQTFAEESSKKSIFSDGGGSWGSSSSYDSGSSSDGGGSWDSGSSSSDSGSSSDGGGSW